MRVLRCVSSCSMQAADSNTSGIETHTVRILKETRSIIASYSAIPPQTATTRSASSGPSTYLRAATANEVSGNDTKTIHYHLQRVQARNKAVSIDWFYWDYPSQKTVFTRVSPVPADKYSQNSPIIQPQNENSSGFRRCYFSYSFFSASCQARRLPSMLRYAASAPWE